MLDSPFKLQRLPRPNLEKSYTSVIQSPEPPHFSSKRRHRKGRSEPNLHRITNYDQENEDPPFLLSFHATPTRPLREWNSDPDGKPGRPISINMSDTPKRLNTSLDLTCHETLPDAEGPESSFADSIGWNLWGEDKSSDK